MRAPGFSLIELSIALAIVAILLTAAVPALVDFSANAQLRQVAEELRDGLANARTEAIRRNTRVQLHAHHGTWQIEVPDPEGAEPEILQQRPLLQGEQRLQLSPTPLLVAFEGNGRLTPGSIPVVARLQPVVEGCLGAGGARRCLNVTVGIGGQARVCDPAQTSQHPAAC